MSSTLLLVLLTFSAPAWSIYKCVSGDQTVYSDAPCQNGAADSMKEIAVATPATDIASAQKQLQQDKQTLQRLQQRRHKADAQEERQQAQRYKDTKRQKRKRRNALNQRNASNGPMKMLPVRSQKLSSEPDKRPAAPQRSINWLAAKGCTEFFRCSVKNMRMSNSGHIRLLRYARALIKSNL